MLVANKISRVELVVVAAACLVPTLVAYYVNPSASFFNQILAIGLWGLSLAIAAEQRKVPHSLGFKALTAAVLLAGLAAPRSALPLAVSIAMLSAFYLFLLAAFGAALLGLHANQRQVGMGLAWGLLLAGVFGALIGAVQVFLPQWVDGVVIGVPSAPGRAVGNLRQPNHLATLLIWAAVGLVWLAVVRNWSSIRLAAMLALLVAGVVMSASRTGLYLGLPLLVIWGLLDRSLGRSVRLVLLSTPLMAVLAWAVLHVWALSTDSTFGAEARLDSEGAGSPARLKLLANAWALLKLEPWTGVGWGQFNRAWTLTEFPDRAIAFFDNAHNLPLQLLVEFGWPVGLLLIGLLFFAYTAAARQAFRALGPDAIHRRAPFLILTVVGIHSLLEYPLWYAYFLLPTAFAWGLCLAPAPFAVEVIRSGGSRNGRQVIGVLLLAASCFAIWEYSQVTPIFERTSSRDVLSQRIEHGQQTVLFAAHAEYAAAMLSEANANGVVAASRAGRRLIDAKLLIAWAKSLHAVGETDKARYLVARLREFRSEEGKAWLASCPEKPELWFCAPPARRYSWRDF